MQKNSPPLGLYDFDDLPNSGYVRLDTVRALLGISSATVWRRIKSGDLPATENHGGRAALMSVGKLRQKLAG